MRTLIKTLTLFCLAAPLTACAGNHIRWTEEVKLSDGQVIQLQRHVELTASGFPVQNRGFDKYQEICYPPLGIHWKSRGGYQPDIFDIVNGKAYIHVPVTSQVECYEQGSPETGAIYFVWENGKWKRINHDQFPAISEWNLLMQTSRGSTNADPQGLITVSDKTTGNWRDSSLRNEQKRLGWRRVNESYASREGCKPYGKGPGWCADAKCTRLRESPSEPIDIFYKDLSNTCQ
jgi:hypothetical protein